ncbi:MAG: T9SS type A sorting domain-containing protein [Saprospiraceae bacterium]|nr:T9SS type A sorting domain-containing protein [Saprospiraceae bacterium]
MEYFLTILIGVFLTLQSVAQTVSSTFNYTGGMQTFTVPYGVTSISIQARGAQGASGTGASGGSGGFGALATGDLVVTPGQVLNIFVGGAASGQTGGFNGGATGGGGTGYDGGAGAIGMGGGGGGASDIRVGGITLGDRVIVAGGGGGGGATGCFTPHMGGNGGSGGGGNGGNGVNSPSGGGGFGGTLGVGGAAGIGCGGFLGMAGSNTGTGGNGQGCCCQAVPAGGGGGGGFVTGGGGGGGSAGTTGCQFNDKGGGGGGAGGSNLIAGLIAASVTNGVQSGNGQVVITYIPCPDSPNITLAYSGSPYCSNNGTSQTPVLSAPVIDGILDANGRWGGPVSLSDDVVGWPNDGPTNPFGNNVNVNDLYVTSDAQYVYFGATINSAADWQSWGFAINTIDGSGGSSEVWNFRIGYGHSQLPDYVVKGHFGRGGAPYAQLVTWNGSSWTGFTDLAGADFRAEETGMVEVRILKSALGNPSNVDVQFYISGNNEFEHATFDAVPDDQVATSWNHNGSGGNPPPTILDTYANNIQVNGAFSATPAGITVNTNTGVFTPSATTPGTYTISYTIPGSNGCPAQTASTMVTVTALPMANIVYSGQICGSGTLSVTQTGATGGTYSSSPTGLSINAMTGAIDQSASTPNTYTVTYTIPAGGGCNSVSASATVILRAPLSLSTTITPSCVGGSTGIIDLTVSGGNPMYTYDWSNDGPETPDNDPQDLTGLASGTYTVTVTDGNACTTSTSASVSQSTSSLILTTTTVQTCSGGSIGSIDLTVSGGTPAYTYDWNNDGAETPDNDPQDLNGLNAGVYTVTVTDAGGCTAVTSANITTQPLPCGWSGEPNGAGCNAGNTVAYNFNTQRFTVTSTNCYYPNSFTSDALAFAQYDLCGNGSITAQVTSITGNALGWAGVTMRESNAAGAKKAQLMTNLSTQSRREFRITTNGAAYPQQFPSQNRYWLRITRTGNQFVMSISPNGTTWYPAGAQNINMNSCIEMGLVVTNYTANSTVTATFANVSVSGGSITKPVINTKEDILAVADFSIMPNPTNGLIEVDLSSYSQRKVQLELYNLQGKLLRSVNIESINGKEEVDLTTFDSGMYLIRVRSEGLPDVTKRVVVNSNY